MGVTRMPLRAGGRGRCARGRRGAQRVRDRPAGGRRSPALPRRGLQHGHDHPRPSVRQRPGRATADPVALRLDLYQPPATDTVNKRPAIVWVHGGGFMRRRQGLRPLARPRQQVREARLRDGLDQLPAVGSGQRLRGHQLPRQRASPPRSTRSTTHRQPSAGCGRTPPRYGIDPGRIAIGGESAGGITATLAGLRADDPGDSGNPGFSSSVRAFASISGGILDGGFVDARRYRRDLLPRHGGQHRALLVVGGHRRTHCATSGRRPTWSCTRERATCRTPSSAPRCSRTPRTTSTGRSTSRTRPVSRWRRPGPPSGSSSGPGSRR